MNKLKNIIKNTPSKVKETIIVLFVLITMLLIFIFGKQNLNNATKEDLIRSSKLIGEKRAELIIQNKPYHSWDDVVKITGIGEGIKGELWQKYYVR